MQREKGRFFKGAMWIAVGGFLSKLIGALYRIPLTNFLGGYGMGLYQLVYPLYTLLLTVSATGIPSAIAKLTAERVGAGSSLRGLINTCLRLFCILGLVGTAVMAALAIPLSRAQGAGEIATGYLAIAPAVLLVSILSVYRGYMQGKNDMFPTALSEILEQLVKVAIGVPVAYIFRATPVRAVTFLLFAVSVAEGAAVIFVWGYAKKKHPLPLQTSLKVKAGEVLKTSLPVTASAALLPLSCLVDSVLVVRMLLRHTSDAVNLYGLFTGGAVTLVNLPVSICYGVAAASIPAVAAAKSRQEGRKKTLFSLFVTLAVSLPCALLIFLLAGTAQRLVYPSLGGENGQILVRLTRLFSVSCISLACTQTLSACLTALGKPLYATLSMGAATLVKTLCNLWWVGNPAFSVYGAALATNVCYLVAFFLDLYYTVRVTKESKTRATDEPSVLAPKRSKDVDGRWFRSKKRRLDGRG